MQNEFQILVIVGEGGRLEAPAFVRFRRSSQT